MTWHPNRKSNSPDVSLSCSLSLSIIQSHKHYNTNNILQRYNINLYYVNKISNQLNLSVLNLNDKKTRNYMILVASVICVLNMEYVTTNSMYIIENSVLCLHCCLRDGSEHRDLDPGSEIWVLDLSYRTYTRLNELSVD